MPPRLQPPRAASQFSQTDISELKSQMVKKLGPDRAQRYFALLNGLLLQQLNKVEFDNLCVKLLGRENLRLHNLLIRSILRNACQAKCPPLTNQEEKVSRTSGVLIKKSPQTENGLSSPQTVNPAPNIFSNGDVLPQSPCKIRSDTLSRRFEDYPYLLRQDDKVDVDSLSSYSLEEAVCKENGAVSLHDLKRPSQYQQGVSAEHLAKRPRVHKAVEVVPFDLDSSRGPLEAPLGIPCFYTSTESALRSLISSAFTSTSTDSFSRNYDSDELCQTEILKRRMEKVAEAQGLEGVTLDCANLLNNGLDLYLKKLIRSTIELVGARLHHESVPKQKPYIKPVNGVWVDHHIQAQNSNRDYEGQNELRKNFSITMQDLKVAMELKPQQLGEDRPMLLEKICMHSFQE